jgi:hypothetical protein
VHRSASEKQEEVRVRASVTARLGDEYYWRRNFGKALEAYGHCLHENPWMPSVWAKYIILRTGNFGIQLRGAILTVRQLIGRTEIQPMNAARRRQ